MSCYTCFFVRIGDRFARLGAYSRNNAVARTLNECGVVVPWEKITNVTDEMINDALKYTCEMIEYENKLIEKYKAQIDLVREMPTETVDERLDKIYEINTYIDEIKEDISEWTFADNFFVVLSNAIEDVKYGGDDDVEPIDSQHYFYCGLEISNPTVNDIV